MLRIKLTGVPCDGLDLDAVARATANYSGADIDGLIELAKDVPDDATIVMMLAPTMELQARADAPAGEKVLHGTYDISGWGGFT